MKTLPVTVRRIGNSLGVVIPRPVLAQAARAIGTRGEDQLLRGEFGNSAEKELD